MDSEIILRWVMPEDAQQILDIYAPIITNTATSFETEVPSKSEFQQRILIYSSRSPWLVAEKQGRIIGYAYATDHRSRQAYQWNQEVTAYVHKDHRKKGVAKLLYLKLLEILKMMSFSKVIAVITLPNDPSIAFHKALGFKHIGEMKDVGFKNGKWHSTSWWDLDLRQSKKAPSILKTINEIREKVDMKS